MRIGILGGTFDPPHNGHLALAHAAQDQLQLDEVLFIPANRNPLKSRRLQTPAKHRLAMVQHMICAEPRMGSTDMEITRGGVSYTVDTLSELHMVRPGDYWFLLGADALKGVSGWKSPNRLVKLCRFGVAIRRPLTISDILLKLPDEVRSVVDSIDMDAADVSSTELRSRLHLKQFVGNWIMPEVQQYIEANNLYRDA